MKEHWGSQWGDWIYLGAVGAAGGVMVLWDSRVMEKIDDEFGMYSVPCLFKNLVNGYRWVFTGVHAPVIYHHRGDLWDELLAMMFRWDAHCASEGILMLIRFPNERLGVTLLLDLCGGFQSLSMIWSWLIRLSMGVAIHGLVLRKIRVCLALIGSCFPFLGRSIFQMWLSFLYRGLSRITCLFW